MPVGSGSIKRVSAKVTETEPVKIAEQKAEPVKKATTTKKPTAKKPSTKKAVAKTTTTKKSQTTQKAVVAKTDINAVCHITENLPIHLL